jgi:lysyl-tRNA synthetase class 2
MSKRTPLNFLADPIARERYRKVEQLRGLGINPYPAAAFRTDTRVAEIRRAPENYLDAAKPVTISGRLTAVRDMGRTVFADLFDQGERIQLYFRANALPELAWQVLSLLDIGDHVGISGTIIRTRAGELTVHVSALAVLSKAAHPMPIGKVDSEGDAHSGLANVGALSRHRHVALMTDKALRERIQARPRALRVIRDTFDEWGFTEVETPILGNAYGGAAARPFVSRVHATKSLAFLRISLENDLKRAFCGELGPIYEIGHNFRNEGIDASHNPEFSMMEWYEPNSDYLHQMERFEELIPRVAEAVAGSSRITYQGRTIDLSAPWKRLPVLNALEERLGRDLRSVPTEDLPRIFEAACPGSLMSVRRDATWGESVMAMFEQLIEPGIWEPTFVTDYPVDVSPLTKRHRDDPSLVERFEPFIAGMEIGNSYSELNDPWEQYERLLAQQDGREDAYDIDEDFLVAIAHGMQQAGGSGLGIDRLIMLLTDARSIRDIILFPMVTGRSTSNAPAIEHDEEDRRAR